jgi:surface protein
MASSTLTPSLFLLSLVCSLGFCSLTPIASFHISRYFYPPTAFYSAFKFNADLSKWSTANVTDMSSSTSTSSSFSDDPCFFHLNSVHSSPFLFFFFPVFDNSGFKRTLCGGAWSLAFPTATGTNGRYGCCDAGAYMANPELNPFIKANACQNCPMLDDNPTENSHTSCSGGINGGGEGENGEIGDGTNATGLFYSPSSVPMYSETTEMVQQSVVPLFEWLGSLLFLVGIWLGNTSCFLSVANCCTFSHLTF